jgi:hypothetical protein
MFLDGLPQLSERVFIVNLYMIPYHQRRQLVLYSFQNISMFSFQFISPLTLHLFYTPTPRRGGGYTVLPLSVSPSVQDIFRHIFLSNYWWQRYDIWSQASYRYPISWEAFLDPSDSYFLFADFVDFYTHWTYILYMPIFSHIFLSNYWWQKSDIWTQASYRYPISWEEFLDPSDSYFLFAEERGYHNAHSSSCWVLMFKNQWRQMLLTYEKHFHDHIISLRGEV